MWFARGRLGNTGAERAAGGAVPRDRAGWLAPGGSHEIAPRFLAQDDNGRFAARLRRDEQDGGSISPVDPAISSADHSAPPEP